MAAQKSRKDTVCNKPIRGTREWAVAEINCSLGCPHECRYCYARYKLVEQQGLITGEQWSSCRVLPDEVTRERPLYPGQVMFPSNHDIVPENIEASVGVIKKLVDVGNRVLVVSKPHLACIERLCSDFIEVREQLLFRFTITARDNTLLRFWEPQAPEYEERKACLEYAFNKGFATSVSVEPMLDTADVAEMVQELSPFISHSIWLGKMNKIDQRVTCHSKEMRREINRIKKGQSDKRVFELYEKLHNLPKVRWKESVKVVVGIELAEDPGLDQ